MANIDIFNIQPHQVSRDLRGYSVFFYGDPKSGKTTIATKFPKHFLLALKRVITLFQARWLSLSILGVSSARFSAS